MTEIEKVVTVAVNGQHPGVWMVFGAELFAELADGQCLTTHINAGIVEEQLIHHLLGYQIMHIGWGLHQKAVNAKALEQVQCSL